MAKFQMAVVFLVPFTLASFSATLFHFTDLDLTLIIAQAVFLFGFRVLSAFSLSRIHHPSYRVNTKNGLLINSGKTNRIALFFCWYVSSLAITIYLNTIFPSYYLAWIILQQICIFHGIAGILWNGSITAVLRLLPVPFYILLTMGTILFKAISNDLENRFIGIFNNDPLSWFTAFLIHLLPYIFNLILLFYLINHLHRIMIPRRVRRLQRNA